MPSFLFLKVSLVSPTPILFYSVLETLDSEAKRSRSQYCVWAMQPLRTGCGSTRPVNAGSGSPCIPCASLCVSQVRPW